MTTKGLFKIVILLIVILAAVDAGLFFVIFDYTKRPSVSVEPESATELSAAETVVSDKLTESASEEVVVQIPVAPRQQEELSEIVTEPVREAIVQEVNASVMSLDVPYMSESPDGSWAGPWKNACEEASVAMVEYFYAAKHAPTNKEAMNFMSSLFAEQNAEYGSNANSDAERTAWMINNFTLFNAVVHESPTLDAIKEELRAGRPVITPHYGFALQNKNIPFLPTGSSYHMTVIAGFDDARGVFLVHDPGDTKDGVLHEYAYETFMKSIRDYNFAAERANGPARAIFTYPKLVKTPDSPQVYYLAHGSKRHILTEQAFHANEWEWRFVKTVDPAWLAGFAPDEPVTAALCTAATC